MSMELKWYIKNEYLAWKRQSWINRNKGGKRHLNTNRNYDQVCTWEGEIFRLLGLNKARYTKVRGIETSKLSLFLSSSALSFWTQKSPESKYIIF